MSDLKSKISNAELEKKLAITEAVNIIEKKRDELVGELKVKMWRKNYLKHPKEKYTAELKTKDDIIKLKDEEISLRKEMKIKLSTKMIGETLEQHCELNLISFAQLVFKCLFRKRQRFKNWQ